MNPKNDRTKSRQPRPAETPAPPRRFRIEKLEERIAPKKGGNGKGNGSFCCGGPIRTWGGS